MPRAKTTEDYMSTEGAQSAVKVVQEKMDAGSSAEDVVRSLADSGLRVYSEGEMDEYKAEEESGDAALPEAMMEKPEEKPSEEGGESGEPGDMKGLTILAIRSALKQDSENKEAKRKETEQEALNV